MTSDDIANLSDRMLGYALHDTTPTRDELGAIAAELLKFSYIMAVMENWPIPQSARRPLQRCPLPRGDMSEDHDATLTALPEREAELTERLAIIQIDLNCLRVENRRLRQRFTDLQEPT